MLATLASNRVQGVATAGERVLDILFGCFQLCRSTQVSLDCIDFALRLNICHDSLQFCFFFLYFIKYTIVHISYITFVHCLRNVFCKF